MKWVPPCAGIFVHPRGCFDVWGGGSTVEVGKFRFASPLPPGCELCTERKFACMGSENSQNSPRLPTPPSVVSFFRAGIVSPRQELLASPLCMNFTYCYLYYESIVFCAGR